jgi:RHS repeat-associated protein
VLPVSAEPTSANLPLVGSLEGEAQVVQGQLNYTLPLDLPAGPHGLSPALALEYQPNAGNGLLGVGFQLTGLSAISRCPATRELDGVVGAVRFDTNDKFCLGGERLIAIQGADGGDGTEYRTQHESYARIRSYGQTVNGPLYWRVWDKSGYIREYGQVAAARETGWQGAVAAWRLNQQRDRFGNAIDVDYETVHGMVRPAAIRWSVYRLDFGYTQRPDTMVAYRFGQQYVQQDQLVALTVYVNDQVRHGYQLHYALSQTGFSRLAGVQLCDAAGQCTPETSFSWHTETNTQANQVHDLVADGNRDFAGYAISDLNRDGQPDLCYLDHGLHCGLDADHAPTYTRWTTALNDARWNSYARASTLQLIDLDNDLLPDVCVVDEQGVYCGQNVAGQRFADFSYRSQAFDEDDTVQFVDINADTLPDLCAFAEGGLVCALNDQSGRFGARQRIADTVFVQKSGDQVNPTVRLIDINGDGQTDLCGSGGTPGTTNSPLARRLHCHLQIGRDANHLPQYSAATPWQTEQTRLGADWWDDTFAASFRWTELNADGLADICYRQGDDYRCALNTGVSFTEAVSWSQIDSSWGSDQDLADNTHLGSLMMPDLDQDGRADLCLITSQYQLHCGYNRGGFSALQSIGAIEYVPDAITLPNGDENILLYHPLKMADVTADSIPDVCYRSHVGLSCRQIPAYHHALLTGVRSGYGNTAEFEYGWLTDPAVHTPDPDTNLSDDLYPVTPALRVIRAISASNGIGGQSRQTYHYVGMTWDNAEHRRSYRQEQVTNEATQRRRITHYQLGGEQHGQVERTEDWLLNPADASSSSSPRLLGAVDLTTQILSSPQDTRIKRQQIVRQVQYQYDLDGSLLSTIQTDTDPAQVDAYGNPGQIVVTTQAPGQTAHRKTTLTRYQNDAAHWLIGKPTAMQAIHEQGEQRIERTTAFEYAPVTGALIREVIQPGDPLQLISEFTYNTRGNRISTRLSATDGSSRSSQTEYDPSGRHPIRRTNALGHTETLSYDPQCGQINTQTGPNGLTTRWEYDSLCRRLLETRPDGGTTTWQYAWSSGYATGMAWQDHSVTQITEHTSGSTPVTVYQDALGRDVRQQSYGDRNKTILQDTRYNARGLVSAATLPYYEGEFPGDAAHWVTTNYDALGRTQSIHKPDASGTPQITRYAYVGHAKQVTNPKGDTTRETQNVLGQSIRIEEPNNSQISNTYDPIGNLTTTSANGRKIHNQYDARGNKIRTDDPAMGVWHYTYNAYGELIEQTDAKGQISRHQYDALGRLIARQSPDENATWTYDTAEHGIGKLAQSSNGNTTRQHTYDTLGRPIQVNTQIQTAAEDKTFTSQIEYDQHSRPMTDIRPDGVAVHRQYDAQGRLQSIHLPKRHVWDYDYLQLEQALDEYVQRIGELQVKVAEHEEKYKHYLLQAETYRAIAAEYEQQSAEAQAAAGELRQAAAQTAQEADQQQRQADHYRALSQHYWNRFGNNYFTYVGSANGYLKYQFKERYCAKAGRKGGCRRYGYHHHNVSLKAHMVDNQCLHLKWQGKRLVCHWGPPRRLHMGRFYADWATRYQRKADESRHIANQKTAEAANKQAEADHYAQKAADMAAKAEDMYAIASQEADWLRVHAQKLDDYEAAATALQRQIEEHQNNDETVLLWAATSRDAAGRIQGELAGNGQLTRREYDPYSGRLNRIITAVGDQAPIRDLHYTYDGNDNVTTREDKINQTSHSYRYDAQDRLLEANILSQQGQRTLRYAYDAYGNLLYKSGAGDMTYDSGNRLIQRIDAQGNTIDYQYDANGNLTKNPDRTLTWTSYNKIQRLVTPTHDASFTYTAERSQIKEERTGPDGKITRYSLGQAFAYQIEDDWYGNQRQLYEHAIIVEGHQVALHRKTIDNGQKQPDETHYLHTDALNSIDTITNAQGQVIERLAFDPFGQRAHPQGQTAQPTTRAPPANNTDSQEQNAPVQPTHTDRGYTGHRHLDDLGLIHMNARLYDPVLGRFLSADIYIQAPGNSQNHNRYSYVLNNPLKYTDPSGHFWWFVVGAIAAAVVAVVVDNPIVRMIAIIAAAAFTGGAALAAMNTTFVAAGSAGLKGMGQLMVAGAAAGFMQGGLATGSLKGALKGAAWGALSAAVAFGVKSLIDPGMMRHLGHGVSQGAMSELRGGDFKSGLVGGFVGHWAGGFAAQLSDQMLPQMIVVGLAGGISAKASGGSFEDGALTAAFSHLFAKTVQSKQLKPTLSQGKGGVAFVGGAMDYEIGGPAITAYRDYLTTNPGASAAYFQWDQYEALALWIDANGGSVTVIGHSYGGNTAATVVAAGHFVDRLITADPVSRIRPSFSDVAANSGSWTNINATGGGRSFANFVAWVGGDWGNSPAGYANHQVWKHSDHADKRMLYYR